jgi:hypothetical protein
MMKDITVFQVTQKDIPDRIITVVAGKKEGVTVWTGMVMSRNGSFIHQAEFSSKEVLNLLEHKIWTVVDFI